jgi:hypothetical protein
VVRDITFSNNILRHVSGGLNILGEDDVRSSQHTERITIRNNLVYDMSATWGGASHFIVMTRSPSEVTVDHNTIFHEGMVVLVDDGAVPGFRFTNNLMPHNTYGIFGSSAGTGVDAINAYFPGAVVTRNAFGGGPAAAYPAGNFFPDLPTFLAQFENVAGEDFRLVSGSTFRGAGTDGKDLGVDFAAFAAATGSSGGGGTSEGSGGVTGTATAIPGTLQAEDFDEGGAGIAYTDTTAGNAGGQYRATDVDIESSSDAGGGYNVGWTRPGEWLIYTVNVTSAGSYTMEFRIASPTGGGTFHLEVDGVDSTGPMIVPNTGGWQSWTTVTDQVTLAAGPQQWRLVFDGASGSVANVNYIRVVPSATGGGGGTSGSIPFGGAAIALPGTIEAENFDQGGSGVGYSDTSPGNTGGQYRTSDVDVGGATDSGGGYRLGWIDAGEWLNYSVNVSGAGTYDIEVRVASNGGGGTFHIEVNGVDKTGPMTIPNTGGWQAWATIRRTGVALAAGPQVWRIVMDGLGETGAVGNINWIRAVAANGSAGSTPVTGTAVALPGTLQAEDFDNGGEGVAFHDLTSLNEGGVHRTTGVDLQNAEDAGGGYNVGWTKAGEWLKYTVNVGAAGTYDLEIRVASPAAGGTFHVEVNGVDRTGPLTIPATGGWQSWTTIRKTGVSLGAGQQVWRIVMDANGSTGSVGNINYLRLVAAGQGPAPGPGSDIVLYSADVTAISGNWVRIGSTSGAGGAKMQSANQGWSTGDQPLAAPDDYFDARFVPEANRAYRVWLRLRGANNASDNDSVWVQFSGAVNASGSPLWRTGTSSGLLVNLETCGGCGMLGWGWSGGAWWLSGTGIVRFANADPQTIRIQTREDGVDVDQIVLSPVTYFNAAPGGVANDSTIVPKQ